MGKKRGGGKKGAAAAGDDDDAGSLCSSSTAACSMNGGEETFIDAQAEAFSSALDDTYESRAATREKAWERIVALLRNNVRLDDCYQSASTLSSRCLSAIRKGGAAEVASAATALALHLVTLGEPNEPLFSEVMPELVRATKHGKGPAVKLAAVESLALCCFVAAEDESTTGEVMDHLQRLWKKDGAKLRAAALRGWCFLYTSLNSQLNSRQLEVLMATFAELLHDPEVEVRAAAGEGLALLYHSSGLADGNYEGFGEDEDEEGFEDEEDEEGLEGLIQEQQQEAAAGAAAAAVAAASLDPSEQQQQSQPQSPSQSPQPPLQQQQQQGANSLSPAGSPAAAAAAANGHCAAADGGAVGTPAPLTPTSVAAGAAAAAAAAGKPPLPGQRQQQTPQQQQQTPQQQQQTRGVCDDTMSLASCSSVSGLDLVVDRMKDLASNRGDRQRRSKRERTVLKGTFRELRQVMEDGRVPEQKIKLRHGDSLLIDSMEGNTMINWLRGFLAGGFQVHLQGNPFLHAVFGFTPLDSRPERLSAQEKRFFRSPCSAASKARSQTRRSERAFKGGW